MYDERRPSTTIAISSTSTRPASSCSAGRWGHRPDGAEDHRRHLRRRRPARWGRVLGQGSDQGRPLGGAYAARYVAKNLVAAELADRIEVNVAYAIGVAHPTSIAVRASAPSGSPSRRSKTSSGSTSIFGRPRSSATFEPEAADLREDGRLRPLRPRRPRLHLGAHRQGRPVPRRRRHLSGREGPAQQEASRRVRTRVHEQASRASGAVAQPRRDRRLARALAGRYEGLTKRPAGRLLAQRLLAVPTLTRYLPVRASAVFICSFRPGSSPWS